MSARSVIMLIVGFTVAAASPDAQALGEVWLHPLAASSDASLGAFVATDGTEKLGP